VTAKVRPRFAVAGLAPGGAWVGRDAVHHLLHVLRLGPGDAFVAFDPGRGVEADATIEATDAGKVQITVGPLRAANVIAARPLVWIQGLPKGEKCDAIVRDVTELGATRFVPVATARAVVRLDGARASERRARWTRIAQEAARQCGRGDAPTIEPPVPWGDALAAIDATYARFCLYEKADAPLAAPLTAALASASALAFAAGPEGGLEPAEVEAARAAGWHVVSLGPYILRTETVATAVLGAVRIFFS
jgi:16S rRNA (uracil1498-N3)-methyltransferase